MASAIEGFARAAASWRLPVAPYDPHMGRVEWAEAVDALAHEYGILNEVIGAFDDRDFLEPSGCRGWTNADLVFHMLLDAQRALVTFNSPSRGPVDRDFVTYWRGFRATDESSRGHARFVRISAAAAAEPSSIGTRWTETAAAAARAARLTSEGELLATQGHTLTTQDFLATLVVEATIHHLDLLANLSGRPSPAATALGITTRTLDGLMERPPPAWEPETYILKATGRKGLDAADRDALGDLAARFPLFG